MLHLQQITNELEIQYPSPSPSHKSRLIIGMNEKVTNSIGKQL